MHASHKEGTDMKKTYETPVLTTEQFDVEDVITVSAGPGLDDRRAQWEIPIEFH